jgi:hypothetical protein
MQITQTRKLEDIIFDLNDWLSQRRRRLYFQTLQCQSTTNIGWLLRSFQRIDINWLEMEIKKIARVSIQLRYQNIATGNGKGGNTVRALHVIANQKKANRVSSTFQRLYSFDKSAFPLGIVMRFIPHILKVSITKKPRILKL